MKRHFKSLKKGLILFLKGARLQTLSAIVIPIALSSGWVFYKTNVLDKTILCFTILSALLIQIAVNFFNDSLDFTEGTDGPKSLGPDRLTATGELTAKQTRNIGFFCCGLSFLLALPLIAKGGWPILLLGLLSFAFAYLYTGTRFSLLKLGLSEFFTFLFFGPIAVIGTYYLQTLSWDWALVYLGIQCGLWSLSILLINHLRDEKEDLNSQRKHVVTLYGRENSLFILIAVKAFIYLVCFYWMGLSLNSGAFSFLTAPFSLVLLYIICIQAPSKKYNLYLALNSLLYMLFAVAWLIGL